MRSWARWFVSLVVFWGVLHADAQDLKKLLTATAQAANTEKQVIPGVQEPGTAFAAPRREEDRPAPIQRFLQRESLTGNWGGVRSRLSKTGLAIEIGYVRDVFANRAGGIRRGAAMPGNLDLTVTLNADQQWGWEGATLFLYVLGNHGASPSDFVGDAQALSNIDAPEALQVYQAWIEQNLFNERFSLRAGLYDLNSEFDVIEAAGLFVNSSFGIGADFAQSGENGPSIFPATSLGLRARVQLMPSVYAHAVVLDGVPGHPDKPRGLHIWLNSADGALVAGELVHHSGNDADAARAKVALGGWYYTSASTESDAGSTIAPRHNRGVYLLAEQPIYHEPGDVSQGLTVFGRYGIADNTINQFGAYLGAGLAYQGLIRGRDEDALGAAIAAAQNSKFFRQEMLQREGIVSNASEVALELTYQAPVTPWLSIQPDVQYIINPGTDAAMKNAFVVGARFALTL